MGVRCLLLVLGLAGCDHLLQLDPIAGPDAAPDAHAACPAMTTEPDEDGDGCPNASDDCPGIADPAQNDGDGDGVGDACDPHPALPGDSIAAAAFFDQGPDAGWILDNPGDWTTGAGEISNSGTIDVTLFHAGMPVYPGIELGYHANASGELRVELRNANSMFYAACHADWNPPDDYSLFLDGLAGATTANHDLRLALHSDAAGSSCNLLGQPIQDTNAVSQEPTNATITVQNGQMIELRYILVYAYASGN